MYTGESNVDFVMVIEKIEKTWPIRWEPLYLRCFRSNNPTPFDLDVLDLS